MVGAARAKQSKRLSWASDVKLCQVRLFLPEDAPIISALGSQDHLQAKGSWPLHATGLDSDDSLPPGFEAPHPFYQFKIDLSQIPIIKWNSPPSVVLNPHWSVVAGEESEEASAEAHRELAVLEAIYPRQSSIPPNPSVSPEARDSSHDDSQTPLVPITAIEDEDAFERLETSLSVDGSSTFQPPAVHNTPEARTPSSSLTDPTRLLIMEHLQQKAATSALGGEKLAVNGAGLATEPDVAAAAAAAFTAIMRSNEQGSLVDQDLLIKILSDPALVQKLFAEYGANNKQHQPQVALLSSALPPPPPPPPPHPQIHAASSATSLAIPPASHLYPVPSAMPSPAMVLPPPVNLQASPSAAAVIPVAANSSSSIPLPVKDVNYYKSLILQHGGDKQEAFVSNAAQFGSYSDSSSIGKVDIDSVRNVGSRQQRDGKSRIPKPCVFFNSPRGCRHGASCLYLHDTSSSTVPQRNESSRGPKRMKVDRGIADRSG